MKAFFSNQWKLIKDSILSFLEIVAIVLAFFLPKFLGLMKYKDKVSQIDATKDNLLWTALFEKGIICLGIVFAIVAYLLVRRFNKERVMNEKDAYYKYWYVWYWFSARILGIRKCNLANVPIYMQVKIVRQNLFKEYLYRISGENKKEKINVRKNLESQLQNDTNATIINLILEDTYSISNSQIPEEYRDNDYIRISRYSDKTKGTRIYSPAFVREVEKAIASLTDKVTLNLFATTNPQNTKEITQTALNAGTRNNVEHLFVFQQNRVEPRDFRKKGKRIF